MSDLISEVHNKGSSLSQACVIIIQRLKCAGLADSPMVCSHVLGLIPDEQSGMYIALHCEKGLAVMELHRLRGEHGEFAGGGESVLCR